MLSFARDGTERECERIAAREDELLTRHFSERLLRDDDALRRERKRTGYFGEKSEDFGNNPSAWSEVVCHL